MSFDEKYQEKWKDPRWQRKRLEVFERDGWACRECGEKDKTLSVHHIYYENNKDGTPKDPWDYPLLALVTMCGEDHEFEKYMREIRDTWLIEQLQFCGLTSGDVSNLWQAACDFGENTTRPLLMGKFMSKLILDKERFRKLAIELDMEQIGVTDE